MQGKGEQGRLTSGGARTNVANYTLQQGVRDVKATQQHRVILTLGRSMAVGLRQREMP